MDEQLKQKLIRTAFEAREFSYSPYSHFMVGAALLAKNGAIYTGCNVENAGYTPSNCAERTAIFKAVSEGVQEFSAIAIVGGKKGQTEFQITAPCGVCRQVLNEFCGPEFPVLLGRTEDDYLETTLGQLLPLAFGPNDLA